MREKLSTKSSLERWLDLTDDQIAQFVDIVLPALVRLYPGTVTTAGAVPADPDDDIIVAGAVESKAKYIVSEDQHLLALENYAGITILSRDAFRDELDRLGLP